MLSCFIDQLDGRFCQNLFAILLDKDLPIEKIPLEASIITRAPSSRKTTWRSWRTTDGRTFTGISKPELDWAVEDGLRLASDAHLILPSAKFKSRSDYLFCIVIVVVGKRMFIKSMKISNFKTFNKVNIDLGLFNVLIGSNASGKSNFIDVIKFIKDLVENGLDTAISLHGGNEYIRNVKIESLENLSLEIFIESEPREDIMAFKEKNESKELLGLFIENIKYKIEIEFYKNIKKYKGFKEEIELKCEFFYLPDINDIKEKKLSKIISNKTLIEDKGTIRISNNYGDIAYITDSFKSERVRQLTEKLAPMKYRLGERIKTPPKSIIESPQTPLLINFVVFLKNISIYDIDPKLPKAATPIVGKTTLDTDGKNLAIVLKSILNDKKKANKFSYIIKDILPFIDKVSVKELGDRSLLTNLKETYYKNKYLPAYLLSDGTINISALIVSLYFGNHPIIIEEPERNIHPHLISKIISMMKDVSIREKKQIIITTHNPEVVKYAGRENILLAHRDEKGFSEVYRPSSKDEVISFLDSDIGIDELFIQNLL